MKYQERFVRAIDVCGDIYDRDVKMTERFTTVDKSFKTYLTNLGKKILRMEWHGEKSYYFDYSRN